MNIVITMAGLGSRFKKAGYTVPKYMIEAKEKTLFEWSLESLTGFDSSNPTYYFIVRKEDQSKRFIDVMCAKRGISQYQVIEIDHITKGQAETAMLAAGQWSSESPLLIYNIDTFVEPGEMCFSQLHGDGFIPCFKGLGDHWSFVRLDETGKVAEIREKKRISDYCTIGAYYFKTASLFEMLYEELYVNTGYSEAGEQYVAPLYELLLHRGGEIFISEVPKDKVHVLGTPEELEEFCEK